MTESEPEADVKSGLRYEIQSAPTEDPMLRSILTSRRQIPSGSAWASGLPGRSLTTPVATAVSITPIQILLRARTRVSGYAQTGGASGIWNLLRGLTTTTKGQTSDTRNRLRGD